MENLFTRGLRLYEYPLRLVYAELTADEMKSSFRDEVPKGIAPLQMMVTVPKKKRRHAVDRVLMRRRIREAYRISRLPLEEALAIRNNETEEPGMRRFVQVAFIYMHGDNVPFEDIENCMKKLLAKLQARLCPATNR